MDFGPDGQALHPHRLHTVGAAAAERPRGTLQPHWREPANEVLHTWLENVRELLQRHFDKRTADAPGALIEGDSIHRSIDRDPRSRADIEAVVAKLTA